MADQPRRQRLPQALVVAGLILCVTAVYAPALRGAMLRPDDLVMLQYVRGHGPLSGFGGAGFRDIWFSDVMYRPFFALQMWAFYRLFGVDYAGYQAAVLAIHVLSALLLYATARSLGGGTPVSALAALAFATHPYVAPLVTWVSDAGTAGRLLGIGIIGLLIQAQEHPRWRVALLPLLVLSPFLREFGLALNAAIALYALAGARRDALNKRWALILGLVAVAANVAYLLIRYAVMGRWIVTTRPEATGLGFVQLAGEQVSGFSTLGRLGLHAYIVAANITGTFFPLFEFTGWVQPVTLIALALAAGAALAVGVLALGGGCPPARRRLALGLLAALTAAGLAGLIATGRMAVFLRVILPEFAKLAPQTLLSCGLLYAAARWRDWTREERLIGFLLLAVVVMNGVVAFPYFRPRNLALGVIGWALLLVLAVGVLARRGERRLAGLMAALLAALVILNGARVHMSLPPQEVRVENFDSADPLCRFDLPDALVAEIGHHYALDEATLQACIDYR